MLCPHHLESCSTELFPKGAVNMLCSATAGWQNDRTCYLLVAVYVKNCHEKLLNIATVY